MTFTQAISTCLSKYVTFSGRASRAEFWWFALFQLLVGIVAGVLDAGLFGGSQIVGNLLALALFLPGLAVSIRRLHDLDRTGWWFLIIFIPLIGFIVLLVFFLTYGTNGANQYGEDPYDDEGLSATRIPSAGRD